MHAGFDVSPLKDFVGPGRLEAHAVWLWLRSSQPGRLTLRWEPVDEPAAVQETCIDLPVDDRRDGTRAVRLPIAGHPPLRACSTYRYEVTHAVGHRVGSGTFTTAPAGPGDTPSRFAIGLMSCHQPFDESGAVHSQAPSMLRAAYRCLEAHDARFLFAVGDQLYTDLPLSRSLLNSDYLNTLLPGCERLEACSAAEVRQLFQHRYRLFWGLPELQALHARFPLYPILDDHDVVDNWGTNPLHRTPPWQAVGQGALEAYADYQAARVLDVDPTPSSFHYSVAYGHTAAFVMDLRSTREPDPAGQLFSNQQAADLEQFLGLHADKAVLLLILSVPLVHVPKKLARLAAPLPGKGEDFSDRWSSPTHLRDRDWFLQTLHAHQRRHPEQRVVLLSGDIHMGIAHRIRWQPEGPELFELVASAITHRTGRLMQFASGLLIRLNRRLATADGTLGASVQRLEGTPGHRRNPYTGLNLGIIEIDTPGLEKPPRLRLSLHGHQDDDPVCVYRTPWL